jgi:hypothetical protein
MLNRFEFRGGFFYCVASPQLNNSLIAISQTPNIPNLSS